MRDIEAIETVAPHIVKGSLEKRLESHGINWANFIALYASQEGKCGICRTQLKVKDLHIDHDHETGIVRGLLCQTCNCGLGQLGDNLVSLRRAVSYLERAASPAWWNVVAGHSRRILSKLYRIGQDMAQGADAP